MKGVVLLKFLEHVDHIIAQQHGGDYRPTVVLTIWGPQKGRLRPLCLVSPTGDKTGQTLILPQGAVGTHERLFEAACREALEKLGLKIRIDAYVGSMPHKLPKARQNGRIGNYLHFVSAYADTLKVKPDGNKNGGVFWAYGLESLVGMTRGARPQKRKAILAAVERTRMWA